MQAPSLHEVQRLFWDSITVKPGPDSIVPAFVGLVRGCNDSDRKTRIRVYSDAYYLRLRGVLREDFPRVAELIGEQQFDEIVKGYLEEFPSSSFSVRHLGHALSGFFRNRTDLPQCLADLAELEWARVEVFDAPDSECATIDDLASVPADAWPSLRFSLIPALQTLRAQFPVHQVWSGGNSLDVSPAETSIRVWRASESRVLHTRMDERESSALHKMITDEPFAAICETFADMPEMKAAQEATAILARWIEDGIIARIGGAA